MLVERKIFITNQNELKRANVYSRIKISLMIKRPSKERKCTLSGAKVKREKNYGVGDEWWW